MLLGHTASALYLLEHAMWACAREEPSRELDVEVFRRWVEEGGIHALVEEVSLARDAPKDRAEVDLMLVYGLEEESIRARL